MEKWGHYVYVLRRPDREDPFHPGKSCPFYVGKGSGRRIKGHRKEAKKLLGKPGGKPFKLRVIYKLWKLGLDFEEEIIISGLSRQESLKLEVKTIAKYGRIDIGTGILVNRTDGGDGVINLSEESREKMRKAATGRPLSEQAKAKLRALKPEDNGFYGKKHTDEAKQKNREAHKGKKMSPRRQDWCDNIRKSKLGHTVSKEARKKIGDAFRGKPWTKARRKAYEEGVKRRKGI